MTEILQRTLDAYVAPAGILAGHPYHQAADLQEHARPSRLTPRVRPFLGDQLPVPPEEGRSNAQGAEETPTRVGFLGAALPAATTRCPARRRSSPHSPVARIAGR